MKALGFILLGVFLALIGKEIVGTALYTKALVDFYEIEDWSVTDHGISPNGKPNFKMGNLISIHDLEAIIPEHGGTAAELCIGVTSERDNISISSVDNGLVCCWSDEDQHLIPFMDRGDRREYLCGSWPFLDKVSKPINPNESKESQHFKTSLVH